MKFRVLVVALTAALTLTLAAGMAWARNPHCAGGIQYLTQALADKQKGNTEDYQREIQKAVMQLEACAAEDPTDFEGIGYLGWVYGEVDSLCAAGKQFDMAIKGLQSKGDKKKVDQFTANQGSFWSIAFNKGIANINTAQERWNPYTNDATSADDTKRKADARKNYDDALVNMNNALCIKPTDTRTLRNIGAIYAFTADYLQAESYFAKALAVTPADSVTSIKDLEMSIKQARTGRAGQLVHEKKYDEAIAYYRGLLKDDPKNADVWAGIGEAAMEKARIETDEAKKKAYNAEAAEGYSKSAAITPAFETHFDAAICYTNSGDNASAEREWRGAIAVKGDDRDAWQNLASTLAELKKYPDAITAAMKAVALDPKDKTGFRQLGGIYTKAQDNLHAKQSLLAYLALDRGKPSAATTDASGADGAKLAAKMGKPEAIYLWEAEGQKYETWFYFTKGLAYHFGSGVQQEKTDWSAALAAK